MKLIPCPNCRQMAVGSPTSAFPGGAPIMVGRFTVDGGKPLVVKCFRCKKSFKLDVNTFHGLPQATEEQLVSLGRIDTKGSM